MNLGPKLKARLQVVYFISASIPLTTRLGCWHTGQKNNNSIFNLPGLHQEPPGSSRWLSHSSDCLQLDIHLKMNGRAHRNSNNGTNTSHSYGFVIHKVLHVHACLWSCLSVSRTYIFGPIVQNSNPEPRNVKAGICSQSYSLFRTWAWKVDALVGILALLLRSCATLGNYLTSLCPCFLICKMELRIVSTSKVLWGSNDKMHVK